MAIYVASQLAMISSQISDCCGNVYNFDVYPGLPILTRIALTITAKTPSSSMAGSVRQARASANITTTSRLLQAGVCSDGSIVDCGERATGA